MEKELYTKIYQVEETHWWYAARRRIIFDWVFQSLEDISQPRILDVGCGTGYNLDHLRKKGFSKVFGADVAPEALEFCRSRGLMNLTCSNILKLPYDDGTFDLVTALDIIEHLEDDQQGLFELRRILKPGGTLVLFVPALQFLWSLQDEVSHHYRRYDIAELKQKTQKAGLHNIKITYANSLLFPLVWAGRIVLRIVRAKKKLNLVSEADLNPSWSNGILERIFSFERVLLRSFNFPIGVSILCVCRNTKAG